MSAFRVRMLQLGDGERRPVLLDEEGVPDWHTTLYVTTQMRNPGLAANTIHAALTSLRTLLEWALAHSIDLQGRFSEGRFLREHELESLCQATNSRSDSLNSPIAAEVSTSQLPRRSEQARARLKYDSQDVNSDTRYMRITHIAHYLRWLATHVVERRDFYIRQESQSGIDAMFQALKIRRPKKAPFSVLTARKGLTRAQQKKLVTLITPGTGENPFTPMVQERNQLIVLMLLELGVRAGELLALRVSDIDFCSNTVVIARRHDDKDDPRAYQPVAKTLDRRLALRDALARRISRYVIDIRRKISGVKKHDFLFVTHRSGPHQGQPLSLKSLFKVFAEIQNASPKELSELSAHVLRHTVNDRFSQAMDQQRLPAAEEEKVRSYMMGWREGSGTAAIYTRRSVEEEALRIGLLLQDPIGLPRETK